jgi:hypothetical protein
MKTCQIVGPSYSGSTVLGYALNTCDRVFFGSETYRLLKSFRQKASENNKCDWWPLCDHCGVNCAYWNREFFKELESMNANTLSEVYELISIRYPDIGIYVDGSKQLRYWH